MTFRENLSSADQGLDNQGGQAIIVSMPEIVAVGQSQRLDVLLTWGLIDIGDVEPFERIGI